MEAYKKEEKEDRYIVERYVYDHFNIAHREFHGRIN